MRKAAQDGNISAIRRAGERLKESVSGIGRSVNGAASAWPFSPDDENAYLRDRYAQELQDVASSRGVQVFDRDGTLIVHPSVVRVLPGERAVRINRRQTSSVRPTRVIGELEALQKSPPRFAPQAFLESLYRAYNALTGVPSSGMGLGGVGQVVPLRRIYDLWTGLPRADRDYTSLDFARDLYNLESSRVTETRSRARVSFPAPTATRSAAGTISFVDQDGRTLVYYGIQFTGVADDQQVGPNTLGPCVETGISRRFRERRRIDDQVCRSGG